MNFIYKTIPRHTEGNIPLDGKIEMHFMIDINRQALKDEHFILLNLTEQMIEPVRYEYIRRKLDVTPLNKLKPNNHYQLQVIGGEHGIRDITGRTMPDTYEIEFYTKDVDEIKPPKILSPNDVVEVREPPVFELEPILEANYYELQISKSNTFHNLEWPNGKVYRITETKVIPDIPYQTGQYYARVRSIDFEEHASSWSPVIRYFYNGTPVIRVPEDPEIPTEEPEEDVTVESKRNIVLQPMSQVQEVSQLEKIKSAFSVKSDATITGLYAKKATPKDKSVNNKLDAIGQIVIEFTEDIDPATVDSKTCYLLSERN